MVGWSGPGTMPIWANCCARMLDGVAPVTLGHVTGQPAYYLCSLTFN